jgi:DNA-binding transcriptional LysR family regulator
MKLDGMQAFVAVAEGGSFSEAARRLQLAKSVVSERLAELERGLGTTLLHRTTRKVSLTEDGAAFLERAARILREVEAAAADLAERRGQLIGPLRLSAPVTFGRLHLAPALWPFLLANPRLRLTLELDDRRVDAAAEGYDAVLRHAAIEESRLVVWRLAPSRRVLVAAPEYLARRGRPQSLSELARHEGIVYSNRGAADWRFMTQDGVVVVRTNAMLVVNNGDLMRDAAIAGLGIAMLPMFIAGPILREGRLEAIELGVGSAQEWVYMAHPEGRRTSAKLRALVEHLRHAFGSPPYWEAGLA